MLSLLATKPNVAVHFMDKFSIFPRTANVYSAAERNKVNENEKQTNTHGRGRDKMKL